MKKKSATAKPVFLLAGGRKSRAGEGNAILREVFCLSGKNAPSVAVIGAANGDNPEFFSRMKAMFQSEGAAEVTLVPTCGGRYDAGTTGRILEAADVVHIGGGDVDAGMAVLAKQGLVAVLRRLYENGTLFFGLSAGSIMLANKWVRWPDENDGERTETFSCLGLADVFCDTHGEDDGWEELIALMKLLPDHSTGYGIHSGAALRVDPDGKVTPIGEVSVYARSGMTVTHRGKRVCAL